MRNISLCTCGYDMTKHDIDGDYPEASISHLFKASGTRLECGKMLELDFCTRPKWHEDAGVECGFRTGGYLW